MNDVRSSSFTVSSLTDRIRHALEPHFTKIYVEAEISGWRRYPSGHCYFTLKDSGAQISAIMFASAFDRCQAKNSLADGAKVLVYGNVAVYPPRGNYQFVVLAAKLIGEGGLMQRYLELKARLKAEGLFSSSRKRTLPFMPRRIAIVTSEAGAVIHDMCNVISRRFPNVEIRLFPALVQGSEAAASISSGIEHFNRSAEHGWLPEIIIIARGGGSFEDLFCFNDEMLVRAVAASKIPTISAVGHETDFTLCDFVADVRAGTPSIAAEIAVPVMSEIVSRLEAASRQMVAALRGRGEWFAQRVDHLFDSLGSTFAAALARSEIKLDGLSRRLVPTLGIVASRAETRLFSAAGRLLPILNARLIESKASLDCERERLRLLSPYDVLDRGYSITVDTDGNVVRDSAMLCKGDRICTRFAEGKVSSVVD